jgi:hypothetical protein
MLVNYQPENGYTGADSATVEIIYNNGTSGKRHYVIAVNQKPAPTEIARVAPAGRQIRAGMLTK